MLVNVSLLCSFTSTCEIKVLSAWQGTIIGGMPIHVKFHSQATENVRDRDRSESYREDVVFGFMIECLG